MIYKYTKCESVIAKIMADADMSDKNLRITDIKDWIFEAVEKIGAPVQYIQRESGVDGCPIYEIHDGHVPVPEDLESLVAVAYSINCKGPWMPVRKNEQTFKQPRAHNIHVGHADVYPLYEKDNRVIEDTPDFLHFDNVPVSKYTHYPEQYMWYKQPTTKA